MKTQLIENLEQLLSTDDVMSIRDSVRTLQNDWKAETAKEVQLQHEQFNNTEHEEGVEFVPTPNDLDEKFGELIKSYRARIDEAGKKLAAERQHNLELKIKLLEEMDKLVKEEQNIKKAFDGFKQIKEKWNSTGDIPGDKYHDLQEKFHKQSQEFFYNINIYKSLQEHDLKINHKKKEELIERAKELESMTSVNEIEILTRSYQREWMEIGPSPRETYKELGDTFFAILRDAQLKVQAHYDELRSHSEENLAKKHVLADRMKEILTMEMTNVSTWHRWSDEVLKLQDEWRQSGYASKKENEAVWSEFRGLCDLFFSKKKVFFEEKKSIFKEHKAKKEELINRAKETQDSTNWKATTDLIKQLQEEWKKIGSADPRDEQKLWQRFRAACDNFFDRKKENFKEQAASQEENLRLKQELITELESFELSGDRNSDINTLRAFSERWISIGFIPKEKINETITRFNTAMDAKYDSVHLKREEKVMNEFRSKLQHMRNGSNSSDGDYKVKKERQNLKDEMDQLKHQIKQYENNMGFFTGKGAEAMRKEVEKKIKAAERDLDELKKKIELITA